jgi:hypothetical protein
MSLNLLCDSRIYFLSLTNCNFQDFKYSANLSPKSVKPEKTTQTSRKCSLISIRHLNTSPSTYLKLTTTRIMLPTFEFNVKNENFRKCRIVAEFYFKNLDSQISSRYSDELHNEAHFDTLTASTTDLLISKVQIYERYY